MGRALALAGLFALAAAGRGTTAYPPMNEWQEAAAAAQRAAAASVVETINQTENYSSSSSSSIPMTGFRMMGTSSGPSPQATQQTAVQEALLDSIMHEVQTIFKNTLTVPGWENMDAAADTVKQIVDRVRERLNMNLNENETGRGMTTAAALRGVTNDFLKEIMVQEAVIETLWAVLRDSQARPWITNEQQAMHVAATQAVHGFLTRMQERLRATGFTEEEITKMLPRPKTCNKDAPQGAPDSCATPRNLFSRGYYGSSYGYYPSYYSSYYYPSYYSSYGYYPRAYSYSYPSYYSYSYPSYYSYSYPSYYSYGYPSYYRSYGYYPSYYYRRLGEMMGPDQFPMAPPPMGATPPPTPAPAPGAVPPPAFAPMGNGMMGMGMGVGMRRAAAMAPPPMAPPPMMGPMGFNRNSSSSRLLEPLNEYESEPERALGGKHRGYGGGCGYGYGSCGYGGYAYGYPMIVSYGYHGFGGCGGYGGYGYYPHSYGYGGCGGHFRRLEVPDLHTPNTTGIQSTIKTENTMGIAPNTFRRVGETRSTPSTTGRGSYVSSSEPTDTHYYPEHSSETSWETYN